MISNDYTQSIISITVISTVHCMEVLLRSSPGNHLIGRLFIQDYESACSD